MIASIAFVFALGGCAGDVGGKYTTIEMRSQPEKADAYLMTVDEWNRLGMASSLSSGTAPPDQYKVGQTPVRKKVPAYRHVFIAWLNGRYQTKEFLPSIPDYTVEVEVPTK